VRDVHSAGYPPKTSMLVNASPDSYALPFSWSPNYAGIPCTVGPGGSCAIPGGNDLIVEADTGSGVVQWIRYSVQNGTLMRGVAPKSGSDPVGSTNNTLASYLDNVINPTSVPVFSYRFDLASPQPNSPQPQPVSLIREVNITLMVRSALPDPQTHQFRTITLTGQATRFNPNQ